MGQPEVVPQFKNLTDSYYLTDLTYKLTIKVYYCPIIFVSHVKIGRLFGNENIIWFNITRNISVTETARYMCP